MAQSFGKELLSRCGKQPVPLLEAVDGRSVGGGERAQPAVALGIAIGFQPAVAEVCMRQNEARLAVTALLRRHPVEADGARRFHPGDAQRA